MSGPGGFAATPPPPYWAVIFTSQQNVGSDDDGYDATAALMAESAAAQPGFLGMESVRGADGLGVTVCYWENEAAIAAWRDDVGHRAAQQMGKAQWYAGYELRIAKVERAYGQRKF